MKKLPTKQLGRFSNIFIQLGLLLVLFVMYLLLEHKIEQKKGMDYDFSCLPSMAYVALNTEVLFRKESKIVPKKAILKKRFLFLMPLLKGEKRRIKKLFWRSQKTPLLLER